MKCFKNFLIVIILILFASCGKDHPTIAPHPHPKSDSQKINPLEKQKNDQETQIIQLPRIEISKIFAKKVDFKTTANDGNVSILTLAENSQTSAQLLLRNKILRLTFKASNQLQPELSDLLVESDDDTYLLPEWDSYIQRPIKYKLSSINPDTIIKDSGNMAIDFGLTIQNPELANKLSKIELKSHFFNITNRSLQPIRSSMLLQSELKLEEIYPQDSNGLKPFYSIENRDLLASSIQNNIKGNHTPAISVANFLITDDKKQSINYKEMKDSLKFMNTKVIISTPAYTNILYVSGFKNVQTLLKSLDGSATFDEYGDLVKLYSFENSLELPIDWDLFSTENSLRGTWKVFFQEENDFHTTNGRELMNPDKTIIISYAFGAELYGTTRELHKLYEGKIETDSISIDKLNSDDEVFVALSANIIGAQYSESLINVPVFWGGRTCLPGEADCFDASPKQKSCPLYEKSFTGEIVTPIIFNDTNISDIVKVKIGDQLISLDHLLVENKKVFLNNGSKLLLRLRFSQSVLGNNHSAKIILPSTINNPSVKLGFMRWGKCRYLRHSNFFTNYNLVPQTKIDQTRYDFVGEVYKKGI